MSQLKDFVIDLELTTKDGMLKEYAAQIAEGSDKITVTIQYSDIDSNDVTTKLMQSVDGEYFQDVEDSEVTLDPTNDSHTWNLAGFSSGLIIAVSLDKGSSTTSIVKAIKYLV